MYISSQYSLEVYKLHFLKLLLVLYLNGSQDLNESGYPGDIRNNLLYHRLRLSRSVLSAGVVPELPRGLQRV
jgi:hypothetical protein